MRWVVVALGVLGCMACVGHGVEPRTKKPQVLVTPAGTQIPALALAFDVSYDHRTDRLIPGYRLLNVAVTNNSLQVIPLDPLQDRWWVVDRRGKRHEAVLNMRHADPDRWAQLPVGLKKLITYPLMIPIGTTQPIDLLFPDHVNLNEFRAVLFRSIGLDKEIQVYTHE